MSHITVILTPEQAVAKLREPGFAKKIYSGKHEGCRCGCLGEYYTAKSIVDCKKFNSMLTRIIKAVPQGAAETNPGYRDSKSVPGIEFTTSYLPKTEVNPEGKEKHWINFTVPSGRVYTVYDED